MSKIKVSAVSLPSGAIWHHVPRWCQPAVWEDPALPPSAPGIPCLWPHHSSLCLHRAFSCVCVFEGHLSSQAGSTLDPGSSPLEIL